MKESSPPKSDKINPEGWVDEHGDYLFRYALSRVSDMHLAEDLVQETFLGALKSASGFRAGSSVRTWLVGILKRKIIDHYRKSGRFATLNFSETIATGSADFFPDGEMKGRWKSASAPGEWGENPEKIFENREFSQILNDCLGRLPDRLGAVFTLRELENLSSETICKELEITSSNLWVMLYRARSILRRCLEVNWFCKDDVRGENLS